LIIKKEDNKIIFEMSNPMIKKWTDFGYIWEKKLTNKKYFYEKVIPEYNDFIKNITDRITASVPRSRQNNEPSNLFMIERYAKNDITGIIVTYRMKIGQLGAIDISLLKEEAPNSSTINKLEYRYMGDSWPYIENIQIKIDDALYTINIEYQSRGTFLILDTEISQVLLTDEMIEGLRNCRSLVIQANGRSRGRPITIANGGMDKINMFFQNE